MPPLTPTPTGTQQVGKFVWFDLLTDDVPGVARFYRGLFGWEFATSSDDSTYTVILHRGTPIGGVVYTDRLAQDVKTSQWLSSISVPDIEEAVELVRTSGGVVHAKPRDLPERGRVAVVTDPQGALVAFVRADGGDPPDREAAPGDWLWSELDGGLHRDRETGYVAGELRTSKTGNWRIVRPRSNTRPRNRRRS